MRPGLYQCLDHLRFIFSCAESTRSLILSGERAQSNIMPGPGCSFPKGAVQRQEPPPSATSAATRMPGRRVPIVTSEPVLRSPVLETTMPKEPRHFGTGTVPLAQATTGYGVRCGGFQHVESAMSMQRPSLRDWCSTEAASLIIASFGAFVFAMVRGSRLLAAVSLVLCLRFSLNVTAGLLNFVGPASRSQVVSIAAVSAALSGAAPSIAEPQSLEETLSDNTPIFLGLSIAVTVGLLLVPGMFAAMSTNKGKFQIETPEDFDRNV
eukprot:s7872_g4.t2